MPFEKRSGKPVPPLPTVAELDILSALWRLGAATVREVHTALGKNSGYTTTLKQMQVMNEKGLVVRSERFRSHVYEAGVPKEQTQQAVVRDLMRRAFDGSARNLMLGALAAERATAEELREIRRMINDFERGRDRDE